MVRHVSALVALLALTWIAGPAAADPRPAEDDLDRRSTTVEIWSAGGTGDLMKQDGFGDAEFLYMTGVLGVVRFAPFVAGVALDFGWRDDDFHVLMGPVAGLALDIVPGFRVESILEIGVHYVDGIGYDFDFTDGVASGDEDTWLLHGGLRIGLTGRIGHDRPRVVIGGWVAAYRDLTSTTHTITYEGGGGSEQWEIGGSIALLGARFGLEW